MIDRSSRGLSATRALRALCLVSLAVLAAGCASKGDKADRPDRADNPFRPDTTVGPASSSPQSEALLKLEAAQAYKQAHEAMVASDYENATKRYSALIARYPFSEYSTQAELEKIFVQYRSFQPDEALLAADRFVREHPRHVHADYVQYLKGLINSYRNQAVSDFLPIDSSKKDVNAERRAYDDFAVLMQRYPNSAYAGDARKRMLYLRNRIASHELSVVRFYVKRQAWVAVAKRAENLIAEYPGAPATVDALGLLKLSYEKLGLKTQLADVEKLIAANAAAIAAAAAPAPKPGPRTDITRQPAQTSALPAPIEVAQADSAATAGQPKSVRDRLDSSLDVLNRSYTLDDPRAPQADASSASPASSGQPGAASLTTGPYVGEPTVINIAPIRIGSDATVASAEPAAADAVTTAAEAPAGVPEKKQKAGLFDFLNKSYTIGGDRKKAEATPP